mmetsp:Transcript_43793/g.115833  ORF Transcript_43793/g.115833 Transcript_43793/m.115833 type:complete len:353 (-) Transcript_43793:567-1625(-)
MSALHTTDIGADSAFVGTTWRGLSCPGAERVNTLWDAAHSSKISWQFMEGQLGVLGFTLFTWAMNYVSLIWALLSTVPVGEGWRTVSFDLVNPDDKASTEYVTIWSHIWAAIHRTKPDRCRQNHGAALMSLAEVGGMAMVVDKDLDYAFIRAEAEWTKLDDITAEDSEDRTDGDKQHVRKVIDNVSEQVLSQAKMTVLSVVMGALLANCWQLYTRIMLLSIHGSFADSRPWIRQTKISIMIGTLCLAIRVIVAIRVFVLFSRWDERLQKQLPKERAGCENYGKQLKPLMAFLGGCIFLILVIVVVLALKLWNIDYCYESGYSGVWLVTLKLQSGKIGCLAMPDELKDNTFLG